jgi:hypothetical protein
MSTPSVRAASTKPAAETWEQEELEDGYAPWEVRVDCGSRQAAG